MSTNSKIIKNSIALNGAHVITKFINLALVLLLTSFLGKDGFGLYGSVMAYSSMFMFLTHLGINTFIVKEVSQNRGRAEEIINRSIPIVLILLIPTFVIINLSALFSGWQEAELLIVLISSIFVIFDSGSRFLISIFRSFERMEYEAITNIFERSLLLIMSVIGWVYDFSLMTLLISFAIVEFLKLSLGYIFVRKNFIQIKMTFSLKEAGVIIKKSFPFALVGIFGTISMKIDIVMLKMFHADDVAGFYTVGKRIIESFNFIPENFANALFPTLSLLFVNEIVKYRNTITNSFRLSMVVLIPIVLILYFGAPKIISILFSEEFAESSTALRILSIAYGVVFIKYLLVVVLNSSGRQNLFAMLAGIGMLINIALNYILIPEHKIIGAGFATIIAETLTTVVAFFIVKGEFNLSALSSTILKVGLITLLSLGLYYLLIDYLSEVFVLILFILFYPVSVFVLRVVSKEEIIRLKDFLRRKFAISAK